MDPLSDSFAPIKDLLSQADEILGQLVCRGYLSQTDQDTIRKKLYHVHDLVQCVTHSPPGSERDVQPEESAGVDAQEDASIQIFDLTHIERSTKCSETELQRGHEETSKILPSLPSGTGLEQTSSLEAAPRQDADDSPASPGLSGTTSENEPQEIPQVSDEGSTPVIHTTEAHTDQDEVQHDDWSGNTGHLNNPFVDTKARLMMQRMGWQLGQGLGLSGQGRVEPVLAHLKHGMSGIGMETHIESSRIVQRTEATSGDTSWDKAPKLSDKAIRGFNRLCKDRPLDKNDIPTGGHPLLLRHGGVVVQLVEDGPAIRNQTMRTVTYNVIQDTYEQRIHFAGTVVRALESKYERARGSPNLMVNAGDDLRLIKRYKDHVSAQNIQTGRKGLIKIFAMVLDDEALLKLVDDEDDWSD